MAGPLSHIKVVDLSRVLAGPWSTQMLGDLGAQVTKIERPHAGDDTRHWGPPFITNADGSRGDAGYFLCTNRNKTSLQLDITSDAGQATIRDMVKQADILVENYKVGGLKKYGLDYDSLKDLNPGLIYCSITGFGQTGPYAKRPGYDFMIQAMSGLMSVTGEKDGLPGAGPQKVGIAIADLMTGMYASVGILAALAHRDQTGEGQYIDLALLDCQMAMLSNQGSNYLVGGSAPKRMGNAHLNIVPYQVMPTKDGHLIIAVGNDSQFQSFCRLCARQDWANDPRFATNEARVVNREELIPLLEEVTRHRSTQDWISALEAANVPCGPVNNIEQAFQDPQVIHRHLRRDMTRPDGTKIPVVANPINFSKTPIEYKIAPPKLK
ncbi:CaiB/BaiF CoA-transferase family protein [Paremcibacter congregatus]|uniref:CaiB/BaiF CoA transferase family protein n=1 Tax=Paremcibacter congregatus TaxID=2043170 RepID=UPI0030ECC8AE|tara:strand:- start:4427 stop:5566 length:1140 start_codon:yes stop_codon:yes gene_type:complete